MCFNAALKCMRLAMLVVFSTGMAMAAAPSLPAPPDADALLLRAAALPIHKLKACEPYVDQQNTPSKSTTLGADLAAVLKDLSTHPINHTAQCEPAGPQRYQCNSSWGVQQGELVWSRLYQFQVKVGQNSLLPSTLKCVTLP